jgi:hypothetical protein
MGSYFIRLAAAPKVKISIAERSWYLPLAPPTPAVAGFPAPAAGSELRLIHPYAGKAISEPVSRGW